MFKKYLSYTEIGQIMICTMPFTFKVLYSPFVEFYHIKAVGKRRSWIIPAQFIMTASLYYLRANIEEMLETKQISSLSYILLFLVFIITVQDIAVDSWGIEMLHPKNASYGSTCETIGLQTGWFISTSIFMAFNTPEFCEKYVPWIPTAGPGLPVLTFSNFMFSWATF